MIEAAWLPPWRDLIRVFHRLEARGEIRGGRFIAGLSGEQFALPEAVAALRAIRQKKADGQWIAVCGADPLNLVGSLLANALLVWGLHQGELAIMGVLASLYPLGTVLLALTVLRERLTRLQVVGVVLALAASAALAFG